MPRHLAHRTKARRERDYALESRLLVRGFTHAEIAKRIGITRQMVANDLKEVRQRWLDQQFYSYNERKATELAKIDALEQEAWRAWRRSQQDQTKTKTESAGAELETEEQLLGELATGQVSGRALKASVQKQKRDGNPAFLDRVAWCIDTRAQIWGLDAPKKFAHLVPEGQGAFSRPLGELTDEELFALATRELGSGSVGEIIEAESSPLESPRLHDVHEAGLSGELAPPAIGFDSGPMAEGGDSETSNLHAPEARKVGGCEPPFACPDIRPES